MTMLTVFSVSDPSAPARPLRVMSDAKEIRREVDAVGVLFERWEANVPLARDASPADVLEAYREDVERLKSEGGYATADVIRMRPEFAERGALRAKFLREHTHSDDEVRFFVEGEAAFYIRDGHNVFKLVATPGDLIRVPRGAKHWFDMGPSPHFAAIRLFVNPEGWLADLTGDDVSARVPYYAP